MKRVYTVDEVSDGVRILDAIRLGRVTMEIVTSATTRVRVYGDGHAEVVDVKPND